MGARRLSSEAFAEAFTAHSRALWCVAAGILGRRDAVEDVLQEGTMIAMRKLDQFDADTSFLAWMSQIVRYVALNHARQRQRRPASALDPIVLQAQPHTPIEATPPPVSPRGRLDPDQRAFDDEVLAALHELDDTACACLLLRTVEEMPYRAIALALDIPEGTAMSHVHRSRRTLRERLGERVVTESHR